MQEKLNEVDVDVIQNLVERYKKNPEEANSKWSAKLNWQGGFNTKVQVRDLAPFTISEPEWLAGTNEGASPVEYVLAALGGCMSVGFIATATSLGIKVNSLEVEVSGDINLQVFFGLKEGNSGFNKITANFKVDSDAEESQLQQIISQVNKLSPVKNTLEHNVDVQAQLIRK